MIKPDFEKMKRLLGTKWFAELTGPVFRDVDGWHLRFDAVEFLRTDAANGFEARLLWRGEVVYTFERATVPPLGSFRISPVTGTVEFDLVRE